MQTIAQLQRLSIEYEFC